MDTGQGPRWRPEPASALLSVPGRVQGLEDSARQPAWAPGSSVSPGDAGRSLTPSSWAHWVPGSSVSPGDAGRSFTPSSWAHWAPGSSVSPGEASLGPVLLARASLASGRRPGPVPGGDWVGAGSLGPEQPTRPRWVGRPHLLGVLGKRAERRPGAPAIGPACRALRSAVPEGPQPHFPKWAASLSEAQALPGATQAVARPARPRPRSSRGVRPAWALAAPPAWRHGPQAPAPAAVAPGLRLRSPCRERVQPRAAPRGPDAVGAVLLQGPQDPRGGQGLVQGAEEEVRGGVLPGLGRGAPLPAARRPPGQGGQHHHGDPAAPGLRPVLVHAEQLGDPLPDDGLPAGGPSCPHHPEDGCSYASSGPGKWSRHRGSRGPLHGGHNGRHARTPRPGWTLALRCLTDCQAHLGGRARLPLHRPGDHGAPAGGRVSQQCPSPPRPLHQARAPRRRWLIYHGDVPQPNTRPQAPGPPPHRARGGPELPPGARDAGGGLRVLEEEARGELQHVQGFRWTLGRSFWKTRAAPEGCLLRAHLRAA